MVERFLEGESKIMQVTVLGANGMLGRYVSKYLSSHPLVDRVSSLVRKDFDVATVPDSLLREYLKGANTVINCAGVIKPRVESVGIIETIQVNSIFPHKLANMCEKEGINLIHITTDCVFDGWSNSKYSEINTHNADDLYGRSKSLGEPTNATVIRTSIIGEEPGRETSRSLLEWFKSQAGGECNGFSNHHWNGVTCLELAKLIGSIILNKSYWKGVRHITSPRSVSKYELLKLINEVYELNVKINEVPAAFPCNRILESTYIKPKTLQLKKQLKELKEFEL